MHKQRRPFRVRGWVPMASIPTKVMADDKPAGPVDTRTPTERLADLYLADHLRREAADKAEEKRKADAEQAERQRRQQEADKRRRQQEFSAAEYQIDSVCSQYGLSPEEQAQIEDMITQRKLWAVPASAVEFATVQAMEIAARRPKPREVPYGFVEISGEDF